jgi:hypothetical protein
MEGSNAEDRAVHGPVKAWKETAKGLSLLPRKRLCTLIMN